VGVGFGRSGRTCPLTSSFRIKPLLLTIEKLIYGGDGLARLPGNESPSEKHERGKAVFVPFVLEAEKIEARLTEQKPGFARATADRIVESSPHRVQPGCPYFTHCGGCHYQHAGYEHQLQIKEAILRETLRRTAKLELDSPIHVHPSPPWNYRNRSRLQIRTQPEFVLGYFKQGSQEVLAVEECPISSPLINRGIAALWQLGRAGKVPKGMNEVEFFANADDSKLLVEFGCSEAARRAAIRAFAEELKEATSEIAGVVAFREKERGGSERLLAVGEQSLTYQTHRGSLRVSAGSFFQTNRHRIDELVNIVTEGRSGQLAFDLYAGVGLFSTALACDFRHIVSVELSQTSTSDLSYNLPSNGEAVQFTTEQYLARLENGERIGKGKVLPHTFHKPDLVVVDPPRSGLGEAVARRLEKLSARQIVYVSCDPATLARDVKLLLTAGYHVAQAHLVDMFPQTYHIESVFVLER
jgi:23S rRNA (uracil1939-C5)-methyltransferase